MHLKQAISNKCEIASGAVCTETLFCSFLRILAYLLS
jgi:hypothetical protein